MHRELGDERTRYGRKSLREQVEDVVAWPASHRFATGVILLVVVGALLLASVQGKFEDPANLVVGDCLYVPTAAAKDPTSARPIGEAAVVADAVLAGGAQKAGCAGSHGHEVSAIVTGPEPSVVPGAMPLLLDRGAIQQLTKPLCEAAFAGYIGHALEGSAYVTFPAVPEAPEWIAGGRRTICLVARNDGVWLDHPARGSGE
jgi:heme A synthase